MARISDKDIVVSMVFLTSEQRVDSKGKIFSKPHGGTWKIVQPKTPVTDVAKLIQEKKEMAEERRRFGLEDLCKQFKGVFGGESWMAYEAFKILGKDVDGVWSELNLHRDHIPLDDVVRGGVIYDAYQISLKEMRAAKTPAAA
jgi:hypothetical protein